MQAAFPLQNRLLTFVAMLLALFALAWKNLLSRCYVLLSVFGGEYNYTSFCRPSSFFPPAYSYIFQIGRLQE